MSIRTNPTQPIVGPKTYAETQGEPPFDWNAFLRNPPTVGSGEHVAAVGRAEFWVTCACGNQCAVIPRRASDQKESNGVPLDNELRECGHRFYSAIKRGFWGTAREILAAIEQRSAELIAQLTQP